ncbi:MAG TPA: universal stress protein [Azospirillum sp.]|nr:universal stress protein [Azospirillum sp.]
MSIQHLLVHVDATERATARLDFAVALAKRFQAKLTGLFAQKESFGPSIVARRASENLLKSMDETRARFEAAVAAAGVTGEWWQVQHGEHTNVVTQTVICARYADLAILGQHDPDASVVPEDVVEQVLLNSGRPVLVFPHIGRFGPPGGKTLIAWNGSREAARAVNDAIPFMKGAEAVTVLAVHAGELPHDPGKVPNVDIVAHLAAHGITANLERLPLSEIAFADAVLNRAYETDSNLLVMGGYGQYGFPHLLRGSNTRHILRTLTLPALLSH